MTTTQRLVHTHAHYRVINGRTVYVADYHSQHAAAEHPEAQLHQRTESGRRRDGRGYVRATTGSDAAVIEDVAKDLGISYQRTRAGATHHGRQGAYDHIYVSTPEEADRIHQALAARAGGAPVPARQTAARQPRVSPLRPTPGQVQEGFSQIAPPTAHIPPTGAQVAQDFDAIFGAAFIPEVRDSDRFGARPKQAAEPLTYAKATAIATEFQARTGIRVTVNEDFCTQWNTKGLDFKQYLDDCFSAFGSGLALKFTGIRSGGFGISGQGGDINTLTRYIYFEERKASHSYLELKASSRGKGAATEFLAKSMDYYKRFGLTTVEVCAGLSGGGYTWSRYGFRPNGFTTWRDQRAVIRRRAADLTSSFDAAIANESGTKKAKLERAKAWWTTPGNPEKWAAWMTNDAVETQWRVSESPMGAVTMPGTGFQGIFDLNDELCLSRFETYVASKRARAAATTTSRRA